MPNPCSECGHVEEPTVKTLIFAAAMRLDIRKDSSLYDQLDADLTDISPELRDEIRKQGTKHPLSDKTLSQLRKLYS